MNSAWVSGPRRHHSRVTRRDDKSISLGTCEAALRASFFVLFLVFDESFASSFLFLMCHDIASDHKSLHLHEAAAAASAQRGAQLRLRASVFPLIIDPSYMQEPPQLTARRSKSLPCESEQVRLT